MKNSRTIHTLLTIWGKAQRQLPPDNTALKPELLDRFTLSSPSAAARPLPWLPFAFTSLALVVLLFNSVINSIPRNVTIELPAKVKNFVPSSGPSTVTPPQSTLPQAGAGDSSRPPYPDILPQPQPPISDTREFLKVNYNATIRTRQVDDLTQHIQTLIRGFGGRIDSVSSSSQSGYISFVLPASQFEAFKSEIKSLTYAKFLTEQLTTQNLLPQKQMIETQANGAQKNLRQLQDEQAQLVTNHNRFIASLRSQLSSIAKQLAALRAEVTNDPTRQAQIAAQIEILLGQQQSLQARLANENTAYASQRDSLDSQIKDAQSTLNNIQQEDKNLLDNVATVQGTISLQWISILEIISLYLSDFWIFWALFTGAIIAYIVHWYRYTFVLPL